VGHLKDFKLPRINTCEGIDSKWLTNTVFAIRASIPASVDYKEVAVGTASKRKIPFVGGEQPGKVSLSLHSPSI
jgi:hypothetical protein